MTTSSSNLGLSVLMTPMDPETNDAGAHSIGEYLGLLLHVLWDENEGFSGKEPFGNGNWEMDIYRALVRGGLVDGVIDGDGYLDVDDEAANRLVAQAIYEMKRPWMIHEEG